MASLRTEEQTAFQEPPVEFRPAPFWVWNGEIDPDVIRTQLKELAACGFGGAFVHPRPGLVTEYLSEAWFDLWETALEEAERLGLKLHIYDENSYPSGFAGGHVSAELPDCLANCVQFRSYSKERLGELKELISPMLNRPGHPIRAFAVREGDGHRGEVLHDVTQLPVSEWAALGDCFWVYELGTPETNSWMGGFAYTDLLRPEVTELFLKTTHEKYRERFGDRFGTSIQAMFTDEPEISPGNLFQDGDSFLPFSYWFAHEFEKRNGYSLLDYLPCLFRDAYNEAWPVDAKRVRYDYYSTVHELWTNNAVRPVSEWCERNGLAYTGHYVEHNWPHPFNRSSPSVMSMYEYMHWPAVDALSAQLLREEHATAPRYNEKATQLLICIREAHSAANQLGKERVLCEAHGAGGWDSSFEDYKRIGDWLFVNGINFLTHHLVYYTIAGARKRDHPQSFDWRQPWWQEFRSLNDYFGRLSYMLAQGQTHNRILVLNPTTSSFLYTPRDLLENPDYIRELGLTREWAQRLCDCGWDYDWGDEFILERHGRTENGKLVVGHRKYDVVLVPPSMIHAKKGTATLLSRYLEEGGSVLAWDGAGLTRMEGAVWDGGELSDHSGWVKVRDFEELDARLRVRLHPHVEWLSGTQERYRVGVLRRELQDGSVLYFIANGTPDLVEDTVRVNGTRGEEWNPQDGTVRALGRCTGEGRLDMAIRLEASGSVLLRVYKEPDTGGDGEQENRQDSIQPSAGGRLVLAGTACTVTAERDNILPLLYCDLKVAGKGYESVSVFHAGRLAYEHHGFASNPWDNGIQFKRRLLDRNARFDEKSGMSVEYRFMIRNGQLPASIFVLVERPELYRVEVNGQQVGIEPGTCWMDHAMGRASIRSHVREGLNVIRLEGRPFSILMEIEPVYIEGDFSVDEENGQWVIRAERTLGLGPWRAIGHPFYSSALSYSKQVKFPAAVSKAEVVLPNWAGAVARVRVDSLDAGLIGLDRGNRLDITSFVTPGREHRISVRVAGSFRNLFGPHFDPGKPRKVAWPRYWRATPISGPPPAGAYDLVDYGLFEDFRIELQG